MSTPVKTSMGTRKIVLHIWRRFVVMCVVNSFMIYAIAGLLILSMYLPLPSTNPSTLRQIKDKYPSQTDTFWRSFESGVGDVLLFNRPSTLMLLYQPESETLLDTILQDLSVYIAKQLGAEYADPIVLDDKELNVPPFSEDYGEVISQFGEELKTRHVMIVKNVDRVFGKVAQAFHALCDEYTPYVEKAVIVFTVQVNRFPEADHLFVEDLLRKSWPEIDEDTFSPLATRMLGMILKVNNSKYEVRGQQISMGLSHIMLPIIVISLLALFYLMTYYYSDIAHMCYNYPQYRESIWANLSDVSLCDHFCMFSRDLDFLDDLVSYLQKKLYLQSFITLEDEDIEDIDEYCCQNKHKLEEGCVLVIFNIEEIQDKLYAFFSNNDNVRTISKQYRFPIIYMIHDEKRQDSFLDGKFIQLLPSIKVFC